MSDYQEARADIELSFLDINRYHEIREQLEELYEDVNNLPCALCDEALKIWFFRNYIYVSEASVWRYRKDVIQ